MRQGLRELYGAVRRVPLLGGLASRMVWAVKGALGHPVGHGQSAPPPRPSPERPAKDIRLQVALAAAQALQERLSPLEPVAEIAPARFPARETALPGRVSVIVSTLDRADWLDRTLCALAYQRHEGFEVIVVAGPCRDATQAVLARHAARITTAACPVANLSASRNAGLRLATGDVAAFIDDDAVPEPDWLQRLCAPYADPQVGGVGGFIRDASGLAYQCRVMACDRFGTSAEVETVGRARIDLPGPQVRRFLSLTGTNSSFRREALLAIGGFDEAYAYFLDETDVCLRLAEAGWRLAVAPDAEVHHAYAPNAQRRADRAPLSLAACVRSTAYFTLRNAAAMHGLEAAAQHLDSYVAALRHDTAWRRERGLVSTADAERLLSEIDRGVTDGVHAALAGPRRLMHAAARSLELSPPGPRAAPKHPSRTARLRPTPDGLRLCLLSQEYPSAEKDAGKPVGGVAVWTRALAEAMAADGHEVTVIARAGGGEPSARFETERNAGVWVHRTASASTSGALRRGAAVAALPASVADPAIAAAQEVARIAPRRGFDLVMGPLWDLEPCALLEQGAWPTAVSLHTACTQLAAFKPEWTAAYRRSHVDKVIVGERRLLSRARHVLANSRAIVEDLASAFDMPDLGARATVIAHGLPDLAQGAPPSASKPGVELLFVGRLEPRKGVDVLLAAAPIVLSQTGDVRITLVGEDLPAPGGSSWRDGFLRRHGGAPWRDRLRFEGPLSRDRLLARYAACDVVAAPSRYESFGLTALEAMIFAKPCVASRVGGLPEVVAHGRTGLLVPPDDPAALAEALLHLVRNPGLRAAMGAAARDRYEADFTAAAMARAVEAWAREIVAERRQAAAE